MHSPGHFLLAVSAWFGFVDGNLWCRLHKIHVLRHAIGFAETVPHTPIHHEFPQRNSRPWNL